MEAERKDNKHKWQRGSPLVVYKHKPFPHCREGKRHSTTAPSFRSALKGQREGSKLN